jgi:hypothetical protein
LSRGCGAGKSSGFAFCLEATGFEQTDTHLIASFDEETFPSYDVHEV